MGLSIAFDALSFLVVDDSAYMRAILRAVLSGFGARKIYEAQDGSDGLDKLKAFGPDIALIDWEMPQMSGPEMIKAVRNPDECKHAFVPIILLTAHTERHRILEARKFGVHELLRKPVSPNAIYQRIASIILQPRPFIRTTAYFGPEPRDEIVASIEQKRDATYIDKRGGESETNIDDYQGDTDEAKKAESAA